jgi:hypothetical protein
MLSRKPKKFREIKDDAPDSPMEEPSRPGIREELNHDRSSLNEFPNMNKPPSMEDTHQNDKSPSPKNNPIQSNSDENQIRSPEKTEFRSKINLSNIIMKPLIRNFGIEQDVSLKKVLNLRLHSPGTTSPIIFKPGHSWSRDGSRESSPRSPSSPKHREAKYFPIPSFKDQMAQDRPKRIVKMDILLTDLTTAFETEGTATLDEVKQNFSGIFTDDEFFDFDYFNLIPKHNNDPSFEYIGCKPKHGEFDFKFLKNLMSDNKAMRVSIEKTHQTMQQLSLENEQTRIEIERVKVESTKTQEFETLRNLATHYERLLQDTLSILRQLKAQQEIL